MRDREAILSSVIEGTHSTPRELLLFELDQDSIQKKSADSHRVVFNQKSMPSLMTSWIHKTVGLGNTHHGSSVPDVVFRDPATYAISSI